MCAGKDVREQPFLILARSFRSRSRMRRVKFRLDSKSERWVGSGKFSSGIPVMSETVFPAPARSSSIWRCSSSRHFSRTFRSIATPERRLFQNYNLSFFDRGCKAAVHVFPRSIRKTLLHMLISGKTGSAPRTSPAPKARGQPSPPLFLPLRRANKIRCSGRS